MYASFHGLQREPFSIAPDPRFLYMSDAHREALAHLLYGLTGGGGFVLLTGEIGAGKTTVCRCFLEQLPPHCDVAYVFNPKLGVVELLQTVCEEFRVEVAPGAATVKGYVDALNRFLLAAHAAGRQAMLVIDEAQALSADVLEQLRLLTNLETNERKLLQIVLIGQPELRAMLARPELEQLAQRVVARCHLPALTAAETAAYVRHRLAVAGLSGDAPFDDAALAALHRLGGGVPRRINLLADRALLGGYASGQRRIGRAIVEQAAREVFGAPPRTPARAPRAVLAAWAGTALLAGGVVAWRAASGPGAATAADGAVPAVRLASVEGAASAGRGVAPAGRGAAPGATGTPGDPVSPGASGASGEPASPDALGAPDAPAALGDRTSTAATGASGDRPSPAARAPTGPPRVPGDRLPSGVRAASDDATATRPARPSRMPVIDAATLLARAAASEAEGWRALAARWGAHAEGGAPCGALAAAGLACWRTTTGLAQVRELGRPGLLALRTGDGRRRWALLVALDDAHATLALADGVTRVPLAALATVWRGEFATLWRPPPGWNGGAGDAQALRGWLAARLPGRGELPARLVAFQVARGLQPDGRAGPLTLMQLNVAAGVDEPRLASAS